MCRSLPAVRRAGRDRRPSAGRPARLLLAACFLFGTASGAAGHPSCPNAGAIYHPNPRHWDRHLFLSLRIEDQKREIDPTGQQERWTFTASIGSRRAELVLFKSCPTGGLCRVYPPGAELTDPYSDVIVLDDRFRQAASGNAPRAIIMPGFSSRSWDGVTRWRQAAGSENDPVIPDLRSDIVWTRFRCGVRPPG